MNIRRTPTDESNVSISISPEIGFPVSCKKKSKNQIWRSQFSKYTAIREEQGTGDYYKMQWRLSVFAGVLMVNGAGSARSISERGDLAPFAEEAVARGLVHEITPLDSMTHGNS